ncbi:HAD family phosphatase [Enterococcus hulanensis]|uniref:HAD family hydrolase n=1 Tax=Enterococcus hulanensis TaxID=2559929 RepID=UPI001A8ECC50|nr:HAD family hydrolase [Enterococcus hulanensis]MBO0458190.1 HAD family phosphatase [Enterococcus hulanensis]
MKLVAIDLDGTLLNSQHQLVEENTRTLLRAKDSGIQLALATGRSIISAVEMLEQMDLEGYVLALNGTLIAHRTKDQVEILRISQLKKSEVQNAFDIALREKVTFIASNESGSDRVPFEENTELVQEFLIKRQDLRCVTVEQMQQKINDDSVHYLKLAFTNQKRKKLLELKQRLEEVGLNTIFSDTSYIEYVPKGINKGMALKFLCDHLGISLNDTLAIGDQENDIELLQMSGISVAMGNAQEHVMEIADYVTETNDDAGVSKALQQYL